MILFGKPTSTNTLSVVAFPQETVNATNGECETSLGGTAVKRAVSIESR